MERSQAWIRLLKVLKNIDDIGICYLTSDDVVRHPLVQKIVKAYDEYEAPRQRRKKAGPPGRKRTEEMTVTIEYEAEERLEVPYEEIIRNVVEEALDYVECPYDAEVNVVLTDNEGIHQINLDMRGIDRPTDVLSFPMCDFETPGDFDRAGGDAGGVFQSGYGRADAGGYRDLCGKGKGTGGKIRPFGDQGAGLFSGPQHAPFKRL